MFGDKTQPTYSKITKRRRINIHHYVTEQEFYLLREKGLSIKEICKLVEFPSTPLVLNKYAIKEGWNIGKKAKAVKACIDVNEDFFKEINRSSAWVYGWVVTDGSVQEKSGHIGIGLKSIDKDVLYKIKNLMRFEGNIYDRTSRDGRKSSTLRICRKSMCEDLFALGMARKDKTFNTTFPNELPDDCYWDFIRGVFEGDGSVSHRTGNTDALQVSICGATESFIDELQRTLLERGVNTRKSCNRNGVYVIECRSNADSLRMCYYMYANTTEQTRLNRKFAVFQNYVATYYDKVKRKSVPSIELVELARQTIPECHEEFNAISTQKEAV